MLLIEQFLFSRCIIIVEGNYQCIKAKTFMQIFSLIIIVSEVAITVFKSDLLGHEFKGAIYAINQLFDNFLYLIYYYIKLIIFYLIFFQLLLEG